LEKSGLAGHVIPFALSDAALTDPNTQRGCDRRTRRSAHRHPLRTRARKAMAVAHQGNPARPENPCRREERPRQAGLLACGSGPGRPPSQERVPNGSWPNGSPLTVAGAARDFPPVPS
jgi:hypothetical protein